MSGRHRLKESEEEPAGPVWPAWRMAAAALWPVIVAAAYLALTVLPLLR